MNGNSYKQISVPPTSAPKTYYGIDAAKLFMAILVVCIHVVPLGVTENDGVVFYDGHIHTAAAVNFLISHCLARIAVPFFFIASGFLLYRKMSIQAFDGAVVKKYLKRIIKLYVLWSIIYLPVSFRATIAGSISFADALPGYIRNFFFTGSSSQFWYLTGLVVAVSIVSVMLWAKIKPAHIVVAALILYAFGLLGQSYYGLIEPFLAESGLIEIIKKIGVVVVTTRNGLFDGFIFVALGMCFAYFNINMRTKRALTMFLISMVLLLAEIILTHYTGIARAYDMYIMLVPAAFFCFGLFQSLQLRPRPIYLTMRNMSSMIFYLHLWVRFIIVRVYFHFTDPQLTETWAEFALTLAITIILSYIIIKLSERKGFRWLKGLYG